MNRNRRLSGVGCLIVFILVIPLLLSACNHTGIPTGDYDAIYTREIPTFSFTDGQFTILQLTDLHLYGNNGVKDKLTLDHVEKTIVELRPDLVVITGDAVDGENKKAKYDKGAALKRLAEMLESTEVYWAYVPGNNDGEYLGDNRAVIAFLMQYPHCVVGNEVGVDGAVNYQIDVMNSQNTALEQRLILMDSGSKTDGEIHGFYPSQEEWVKRKLKVNEGVQTAVFFHIPTVEFAAAWEGGLFAANYPQQNRYPTYTISETSAGMGRLLSETAEVGLISVGHVHSNNYAAFYNDKFYHFALCSGYGASKRLSDKTGASLITIYEQSALGRYVFRAYAY